MTPVWYTRENGKGNENISLEKAVCSCNSYHRLSELRKQGSHDRCSIQDPRILL
jgi:hypothetical protein